MATVFMIGSTAEYFVRGTAWLSALLYFLSLLDWLPKRKRTVRFRSTRNLYSAGGLVLLFHVILAFHFYHHWSHEDAWRRTEAQSGYGDGIYANYLLIIVWGADVLWAWLAPIHYQSRPRWIGFGIQSFLLFMWFFATTIFALWPMSQIGWALVVILVVLSLMTIWDNR